MGEHAHILEKIYYAPGAVGCFGGLSTLFQKAYESNAYEKRR